MRRTFQKLNTRLVALAMAVMLLICAVPTVSAAETSGSCGSSLTWTFADGSLTITGSGDMKDYSEWTLPPWYAFREEILWLSLPEGLTSVGDMAFYDCVNLTAVAIPSSVTAIGELAFCQNRSMTVLSLNSGLRTIGRSAFEQCESLQDVRLPETVTAVGGNAFYSCKALAYVTVPASVTEMGSGVFAYCHSLVRADVHAPLDMLPTWTFYGCENLSSVSLPSRMADTESYAFYGCDSLNTVNFGGNTVDAEALKQKIEQDVPGFDHYGSIAGEATGNTGSSTSTQAGENGGYTVSNTTVTKTENTTVSSTTSNTTTEDGTSTKVEISATVINPEGWNEVVGEITNVKNTQPDTDPVEVSVYVSGENQVPQNVLDALKGDNVVMTVQTQSGAKFTVDCTALDDQQIQDDVQLSYTIGVVEDVPEALAGVLVYQLTFDSSSRINTEVLIRLPGDNARKNASLYQIVRDGELELLQTVLVDDDGYAHFYLASVDHETEYLIGINVPREETQQAIIPEVLHADYGITDTAGGVEYVITGRTSSWNLNIGQVTWIMIGVLTAVVVVVGFAMFALNKRKLRMGYIPDLDDEDFD